MKRLVLIATTAAVLTAGGVATAFAVQSDHDDPSGANVALPTGSFTAQKAAEQAVKDVPGGVVTDVDWDDTKWELDVRTQSGWRELTYDTNGKLLANRPDNHSDDSRHDSADDQSDDRGRDSAQDRTDDKGGDRADHRSDDSGRDDN